MRFIRYTDVEHPDFGAVWRLYTESFPLYEQRYISDQAAAMKDPRYYCCSVWKDAVFVGLLFYWKLDSLYYVEHFAVCQNRRGQGEGSACIEAFCKDKPITALEIDPPMDMLSRRRLAFYKRLGFRENPLAYSHPPYRREYSPHALSLLSRPEMLSKEVCIQFGEELESRVMAYAQGRWEPKGRQ